MFNLNSICSTLSINVLSSLLSLLLINHKIGLIEAAPPDGRSSDDYGRGGNEYRGAFIGKLSTYSHQVSGDVYAIDEFTFLIKEFFYDGLASDAYFWVGATVLPSNVGFIVPDENGKTNKLRQYIHQDIRIRLPDDKRIQSIKWFSVWDIRSQKNFADLYIPEDFQPPSPQSISELSQLSNDVRSAQVLIVDAKTIRIPDFTYDGKRKEAYFWVGVGPQPNSVGEKIPNELGYLEPLGPYKDDLVVLELPGNMTVFDINYISVWDFEAEENLGSVVIPSELNIPPALTEVIKVESRLPNCEQLHQRLQVNWEIFGPQITIELIGQIEPNEYISFGFSGSDNSSRMIDSDVSVNYLDRHLAFSQDYNITGAFPCTNVEGYYRGVCPDVKVGGVDNYQLTVFERVDSLARITFRRNLLNTGDEGDLVIEKTKKTFIVWAVGKLNSLKQPGFHHLYPKQDKYLVFGRRSEKKCFHFTTPSMDTKIIDSSGGSSSGTSSANQISTPGNSNNPLTSTTYQRTSLLTKPWGPLRLLNRSMTTFYSRLGDSGGLRGYYGSTGQASPSLVWYINGLLAPILYVKRGRTYTFRIEGGNNPSMAEVYNPLYITNDPHGGFTEQTTVERKKFHIYAGIEFDRRGRASPTSAGRLCAWKITNFTDPEEQAQATNIGSKQYYFDKRRADTNRFQNFVQYRNTLNYHCDLGNAALLQWTPNSSTPDIVYYQSYTHRDMGNRIVVVDDFGSSYAFIGASSISSSGGGGGGGSGSSSSTSSASAISSFVQSLLSLFTENVHSQYHHPFSFIIFVAIIILAFSSINSCIILS